MRNLSPRFSSSSWAAERRQGLSVPSEQARVENLMHKVQTGVRVKETKCKRLNGKS